jgi:hypothetical protein
MNRKNAISFLAGASLGFIASLAVTLLFLSKPIRSFGSAIVLGLASFVIALRGVKPLASGHMRAAGFFLGYGLGVAIIAILDIIFPPIT